MAGRVTSSTLYDISLSENKKKKSVPQEKELAVFQSIYDKAGRQSSFLYRYEGQLYKENFTYRKDDRVSKAVLPSGSTLTRKYDGLSRTKSESFTTNKKESVLTSSLTYVSTARGETELLKGVETKLKNKTRTTVVLQDSLSYDTVGRVTSDSSHTYAYDTLGRLIHAEDTVAGTVWDYTYDENGNLLSAAEKQKDGTVKEDHYSYAKKMPGQLEKFNGKKLRYEGGNPKTYCGTVLKWMHGRMLKSVGTDIAYTYDQAGNRLTKTLSGNKTEYLLNNGTILTEKRADEKLNYYYSAEGKLLEIGYVRQGAAEHRYSVVRNAMGDITELYTAAGEKVGSYRYDPWGKLLSQETASASSDPDNILTKNPFRYRGYYYDTETGWYYLQSRYYDPQTRRFLNADTTEMLTADCTNLMQYNLYAYCCDNLVNNQDDSGHFPVVFVNALKYIAAARGVEDYFYNQISNQMLCWWEGNW